MRIGFFLYRNTWLKNFGPLIDESLQAGHEVFIFHPPAQEGHKGYQAVSERDLHYLSGQIKIYIIEVNKVESVAEHKLDCLFFLEAYQFIWTLGKQAAFKQLQKAGIRILSLSYFFETSRFPVQALDCVDRTYFLSDYAKDLFFNLNQLDSSSRSTYEQKTYCAGSPLYDQLFGLDKLSLRREYGIAREKKVVLLTAPVLSPSMPWRWSVWRSSDWRERLKRVARAGLWQYGWEALTGPSFEDCLAGLKDFCNRNDALLIVKSRGKQEDPDYMRKYADLYLDGVDDEYYPMFTTYKLLALSDLLVLNQSMSATEAVMAGVPAVNIYVPHHEFIPNAKQTDHQFLDQISAGELNTVLNFEGCTVSVDRRMFPNWIANKTLGDFEINPERRKKYIEYFLGMGETFSSSRILRDVECMTSR